VLAAVGVVVGAGHLAALYSPRVTVAGPVSWTDKVVHPVLFLVPLVVWSLWRGRWQPVAILLAAHAVVSELIQHFCLPNRSGDPWDAVADLLGVGIGVALVIPVLRRRVVTDASARGTSTAGWNRW